MANPLVRPLVLRENPGVLVTCAYCGLDRARWIYADVSTAPPAVQDICALCFLYESPWGTSRTEKIERLVRVSEAFSGMTFQKDETGRVADSREADAVLSRIALGAYMLGMQDKGSKDTDEGKG